MENIFVVVHIYFSILSFKYFLNKIIILLMLSFK